MTEQQRREIKAQLEHEYQQRALKAEPFQEKVMASLESLQSQMEDMWQVMGYRLDGIHDAVKGLGDNFQPLSAAINRVSLEVKDGRKANRAMLVELSQALRETTTVLQRPDTATPNGEALDHILNSVKDLASDMEAHGKEHKAEFELLRASQARLIQSVSLVQKELAFVEGAVPSLSADLAVVARELKQFRQIANIKQQLEDPTTPPKVVMELLWSLQSQIRELHSYVASTSDATSAELRSAEHNLSEQLHHGFASTQNGLLELKVLFSGKFQDAMTEFASGLKKIQVGQAKHSASLNAMSDELLQALQITQEMKLEADNTRQIAKQVEKFTKALDRSAATFEALQTELRQRNRKVDVVVGLVSKLSDAVVEQTKDQKAGFSVLQDSVGGLKSTVDRLQLELREFGTLKKLLEGLQTSVAGISLDRKEADNQLQEAIRLLQNVHTDVLEGKSEVRACYERLDHVRSVNDSLDRIMLQLADDSKDKKVVQELSAKLAVVQETMIKAFRSNMLQCLPSALVIAPKGREESLWKR